MSLKKVVLLGWIEIGRGMRSTVCHSHLWLVFGLLVWSTPLLSLSLHPFLICRVLIDKTYPFLSFLVHLPSSPSLLPLFHCQSLPHFDSILFFFCVGLQIDALSASWPLLGIPHALSLPLPVCVCVCVCVCVWYIHCNTSRGSISCSFITVAMSSMAFRTICHDNNNQSSPCQRLQVPWFSLLSWTPIHAIRTVCMFSGEWRTSSFPV